MGFFSYLTNDTNETVWNVHTKREKTVYLIDDQGNTYKEKAYDGYGVFGGKDIFILFAEMNGLTTKTFPLKDDDYDGEDDEYERVRSDGIDLWHKAIADPELRKTLKFPNLVTYPQTWKNEMPKHCPNQGFFGCGIVK